MFRARKMSTTFKIFLAFVAFFFTISDAAIINNYYGNLTKTNQIFPEQLVQIDNNNNYEFTGAQVHKNYIITTEGVCNGVQKENITIERWNAYIEKNAVESIPKESQYSICVIHLNQDFSVNPLKFRVYKHRLNKELLLVQLYSFHLKELNQKGATTTTFETAKFVFPNMETYMLGMKLDKKADYDELKLGSLIVYAKTDKKVKTDRLVGVIIAKAQTAAGSFALGVELNTKEVADFIKKETHGAVKFRRQ